MTEKQKMLERDDEFSQENWCLAPLTTLLTSFKIFQRNLKLFSSIFALTTLPLSLLLCSLSLSSHPMMSQIYHLEALAMVAPTRFEARQVLKQSREEALSLLRLKALYFVPCYVLSLIATVMAVSSTAVSLSGKRASLSTAVTAVKATWRRPLVTSICVYAIMLVCIQVPRMLAALLSTAALRLPAAVAGAVLEVYLMAVVSLGLVVSIVEERVGLDAVWAGSDLMEGRKFCGWVLSGLLVVVSGAISGEIKRSTDGEDSSRAEWTVAMGLGNKAGMICLFGLVVVWSYVVTTVFYSECRKRHVTSEHIDYGTV
ncbi:uncharacterized protein LOC132277965 [Cornus florida]|uniref:uncharacterized protein LOC132277965 n=1 Tax=Cornus florida TaxID=4283 RepID=UPI0028A1EF06|nr:uncharacterized protein LOC132277965 [Cornus florida]